MGYGCVARAVMERVADLLGIVPMHWWCGVAFFVMSLRQFIHQISDLRGLAQTFHVRPPDDVSIFRVVSDVIFI